MAVAAPLSAEDIASLEAAGLGHIGAKVRALLDRQAHDRHEIEWRDAKIEKLTFVSEISITATKFELVRLNRPSDFGDLPPPSRTSIKVAKSINPENDGHEEEQIHLPGQFWVIVNTSPTRRPGGGWASLGLKRRTSEWYAPNG